MRARSAAIEPMLAASIAKDLGDVGPDDIRPRLIAASDDRRLQSGPRPSPGRSPVSRSPTRKRSRSSTRCSRSSAAGSRRSSGASDPSPHPRGHIERLGDLAGRVLDVGSPSRGCSQTPDLTGHEPHSDARYRRCCMVIEGPAEVLHDRRDEREELDRLLAAVRGGQSRVLVVSGEAGVGKTALLDSAIGSAPGFRVMRAVGRRV